MREELILSEVEGWVPVRAAGSVSPRACFDFAQHERS